MCINNIEAYYAGETPDVFTAKAEELKTYPFTLPQVDEAEAGKCADKDAATTCFVDGNTLLIDFTPVTARYVLLKAVRMVENESPMGFAELGVQ